jgi:transcriptional regulator with AAA-type ATPase domain
MFSLSVELLIVCQNKEKLSRYYNITKELGLQQVSISASIFEARQVLLEKKFDVILFDIPFDKDNNINYTSDLQQFVNEVVIEFPYCGFIFVTNHNGFCLNNCYVFDIIQCNSLKSKDILNSLNIIRSKIKNFKNCLTESNQSIVNTNETFKFYNNNVLVLNGQDKVLTSLAKNKKIPLIMYGETGTGKEELVKVLYQKRVKNEGEIPFVTVNCPLLGDDLTSSLLFGHKKGSFTGANETTNGYIADANGGILFLDEVHTLDQATQRKLLRVLNDGSYARVGETKVCYSHFQLVAATTKDLDEEVESGRMLADFKYRISGAEIHLEPLRERLQDIPSFVKLFFRRENIEINENLILEIAKKCQNVYWKGNIRQLFRTLQKMIIYAQLEEEDLQLKHLLLPQKEILNNKQIEEVTYAADKFDNKVNNVTDAEYQILELLKKAFSEDCPLNDLLDKIEKFVLIKAISRHDSIAKAHAALQISRNAIDAKRKKYHI